MTPAGDGGRELACRCGAELLAELHAAGRKAMNYNGGVVEFWNSAACGRLMNAVRACEALVSELAAGRIHLVPSEVTGVASPPALADAGGLRPSESLPLSQTKGT